MPYHIQRFIKGTAMTKDEWVKDFWGEDRQISEG